MAVLKNLTKNNTVTPSLREARGFSDRLVGLLGQSEMAESDALWIHKCNSVHTFFMKFPIDAVFLDKSLVVEKVYQDLMPWRLTLPSLRAKSVIELKAGVAEKMKIETGDQLHVGN